MVQPNDNGAYRKEGGHNAARPGVVIQVAQS